MLLRRTLVFAAGFVCASPALAAYMLTPLSAGLNDRTVVLGESFSVDVVITSDTADRHTSAVFQTRFTRAGLILSDVIWGTPYVSGGLLDDSVPAGSALPATLNPDTLSGGSYPPGLVDIELANALIGTSFGTGTLVTLELTVPNDPALLGTTFISLNADQIFNGFSEVPTQEGQVFTLNIVIPAPGASAVAAAGLLIAASRRRRL